MSVASCTARCERADDDKRYACQLYGPADWILIGKQFLRHVGAQNSDARVAGDVFIR